MGQETLRGSFERAESVTPEDGAEIHQSAQDDRPEDGPGGGKEPPANNYEEPPEKRGAAFPLNDFGNGLRLLEYFGDDMLFVPRLGWYRWDKNRWLADEDELIVRIEAQKVAGRIEEEIKFLTISKAEQEALDFADKTAEKKTELEDKEPGDRSKEEARRLTELREVARDAAAIRARLDKRKAAHRAHAKNSGNTSKISNMLLEARAKVRAGINELNADPLAVNVANGTLFFRQKGAIEEAPDPLDEAFPHKPAPAAEADGAWEVVLLEHHRDHKISKLIPFAYNPEAECRTWIEFLNRVQPNKEMRDFLQRWVGYCLTGLTTEQKLLFNFGSGRNGKSTFVDTLAKIFADYGTTVPIETLTGTEQRKGSDATPDLVRLPGARFVRASEPEAGTRMKEAMIKALTGGEAIMIRRMMQEFVEVVPEFKLMISGNHKPEIRGADDGIWRRVKLVPWEVQIPDDEVDPMLASKLQQEAEGILAWAVEGFLEWAKHGLGEPEAVRQATREYREESDKMRVFLSTQCRITGQSNDWTPVQDLKDAFNAWLIAEGDMPWGPRAVTRGLRERAGVVKGANGEQFAPCKNSVAGYSGIVVNSDAMDRIAAMRARLDRKINDKLDEGGVSDR